MRLNRRKLIVTMMDKDINIKQLAEKASLSRGTVSSIKNGKSCTKETLNKIAVALEIDAMELLND